MTSLARRDCATLAHPEGSFAGPAANDAGRVQ
jgi:hypothetical protein